MKKVLKTVGLVLCLVLVLSGCNSAGVDSYHRSSSAEENRLTTRYLHENIDAKFRDLGASENIKALSSGDKIEFDLSKRFFLSYYPTGGYILELEQENAESRYFILGKNDFTITVQNRKTGILTLESSVKIIQLPATKQRVENYVSCAGYIKRKEISYYLTEAVTGMTLEKTAKALSICWQDNSGKQFVYHAQFSKDNFVIESGGDFLSTNISYEQEYHYDYSKREGYYSGWKQEDIVFRGYYYNDNKIQDYGSLWDKAPQLQK